MRILCDWPFGLAHLTYPWVVALLVISGWLLTLRMSGVYEKFKSSQQQVSGWIDFLFNFVGYSVALTLVNVQFGQPLLRAAFQWSIAGLLFALCMSALRSKPASPAQ